MKTDLEDRGRMKFRLEGQPGGVIQVQHHALFSAEAIQFMEPPAGSHDRAIRQ